MVKLFFANILLSNHFPMGRMNISTRKKKDWYHSISVFTSQDITKMSIGGKLIECTILQFYGKNGAPILKKSIAKISCVGEHKNHKLYNISCRLGSCAVIGDLRTLDGYTAGHGMTTKTIENITDAAFDKWGNGKIPYVHQRNESYNCVAFIDDILSWVKEDIWSPRIEKLHEKYGLYVE